MVMEPLSRRVRIVVLCSLVLLFFIVLPIVILHASGYRFQGGVGLVRTGGIHITVPYDDAIISLDGTAVGSSGFLNRRFYVNDLLPGSYDVRVKKEGFHAWAHTLVVEPQIVTDARALLIPEEISLTRITTGTSLSTSTHVVSREAYDAYLEGFAIPAATSSPLGEYDRAGNEALFIEKGNVYVRWMNGNAPVTSNFCIRPTSCVREIAIENGKQTSTGAAFYAGGIVYRTREGGIFIRESAVLPGAVLAPLYARRGADFRILNGALIVKEGNSLYEILDI